MAGANNFNQNGGFTVNANNVNIVNSTFNARPSPHGNGNDLQNVNLQVNPGPGPDGNGDKFERLIQDARDSKAWSIGVLFLLVASFIGIIIGGIQYMPHHQGRKGIYLLLLFLGLSFWGFSIILMLFIIHWKGEFIREQISNGERVNNMVDFNNWGRGRIGLTNKFFRGFLVIGIICLLLLVGYEFFLYKEMNLISKMEGEYHLGGRD